MTMVALLRAREDAGRSAALLRARGFDVVLAPATLVRPTGAAPPARWFDGVAATSAKAIALLAPAARAAISGLPLHVVGARAAEAAAETGLALAQPPAPDVAALSATLRERLAPRASVLYLAGRDRKLVLETALREMGARTTLLEVYFAEARGAWSENEALALLACDAVLHYSRRAASLAVALAARAGLNERFGAIVHVCLSDDVAEPLRDAGWPHLACADAATEARLVAALEDAFGL